MINVAFSATFNVAVEVSLYKFFALVETSHGVRLSWMTELAGAPERVTSLLAGGYITESEFASAKAGMHSRCPAGLQYRDGP